jgi:phosphate:Na+ symporter
MTGFGIKNEWKEPMQLDSKFSDKQTAEKYDRIKFVYGEIHSFSIRIQHTMTGKEDLTRLDRLVSSNRNCMYAAKSIKDALPDIEQLKKSSNDVKYDFFVKTQAITRNFCHDIHQLISTKSNETAVQLSKLYSEVTFGYTASLQHLYKESIAKHVTETDISTLLNFNREVVTAFKSLVFATKDYLLDKEHSKYFEDLPGFIR